MNGIPYKTRVKWFFEDCKESQAKTQTVADMNQAYWESRNEAMANKQIEMDQENERLQKTSASTNQAAINGNKEIGLERLLEIRLF